ncbi:hypothetical protein RP300_01780 [Oligella urethralis]|uniref:DUF1850 domain-containing protein n=1 Tax=Oligella urethralis TaxID=90245 RepID=UPI00058B5170|nr:DUF1850 domain-containing protein [Oligella urethralis]WOS38215.1 hypothetical protein RP300_01780 [Oligella urethralis]SUA54665.1 Uncharacterized conserved protein [Oligella urethralis]SUA64986.1 Uncharacterized conserved protein [Oligella urethralis]SUA94481.1 Uncharacterized conserved protein [Oligella urethralis]
MSKHHLPIALLLLMMLGLTAFIIWPQERLKISFQDQTCYLNESEFSLRWRHSVELQDWQEHYYLSSGQLLLDASYLQTFGAGTPSDGETIVAPEGFVGLRSQVILPALHWIVSAYMQGRIISPQGSWEIYRLVPDYTEITIEPKKTFRPFFWLGKNCYDYGYFSDDYRE